MEYRKLIKFGNSSFVVSLPKTWTEKNNLKKGDTVYLEENGNNELIVLPKEIIEKKEDRVIVIDTDGKDPKFINREIVTAYLNDFNIIKLTGKNILRNTNQIKERVHKLMACEVIEQNHEYIICRDFLNIKELSFKDLFRKMDNTIRSMLYDFGNLQNERNSFPFKERCDDINRISFVFHRIMKSSLKDPQTNKSLKTDSFEILYWWFVANRLEYISEGIRDIAISLIDRQINLDPLFVDKGYKEMIELLNRLYNNVIKSFYNGDRDLAMTISDLRYIFNEKSKTLELKFSMIKDVGVIMERFRFIVKLINVIARWVFSN